MAVNVPAGQGALMMLTLMPLMALTLLHQVVAQSPTLLPVTCSLSNASTISPEYCTYYDQQNMASETGGCQTFLTNIDPSPSADCCAGLNKVAYYRTACVCLGTFYPPSNVNMTRNLELPMLCGVTTDLCARCPAFLVGRTADSAPIGAVSNTSTAAKVGAIVLAIVLSLVLLGGIVALFMVAAKKRKAKKSAPEIFEGAPPGGTH